MLQVKSIGIFMLLGTLVLVGCGGSKAAKEKAYLNSKQLPPLEVPPDLIQPKNDPELAIPKKSAFIDKDILKSVNDVRFYRDGGIKWLMVKAPVQEVWPRLLTFWDVRGYSIKLKDKKLGIVETDWLNERTQVKGKTPLQNKYRVRIEKGKNDSTLIFVSHRSLEKQSGKWRSLPSSYEKEVEILRRLLIHFGMKEDKARSALSKVRQLGMKVKLKNADNATQLVVDGEYQRVWRRLLLAFDRAGLIMQKQADNEFEFTLSKQKYLLTIQQESDTATSVRLQPKVNANEIKRLLSDFFLI